VQARQRKGPQENASQSRVLNLNKANHSKGWDAKLLAYVPTLRNMVAGLPGAHNTSHGAVLSARPTDNRQQRGDEPEAMSGRRSCLIIGRCTDHVRYDIYRAHSGVLARRGSI
jgi:hypothetical protein